MMTDLEVQYLLSQSNAEGRGIRPRRRSPVVTFLALGTLAGALLSIVASSGDPHSPFYEARESILATRLTYQHALADWVLWHFGQLGGDSHGLILAITLIAATALLAVKAFDRATA